MAKKNKPVLIRNNHTDYQKKRRQKTALIWTVAVLSVAVLVALGVWFGVDEKLPSVAEQAQQTVEGWIGNIRGRDAGSDEGDATDGMADSPAEAQGEGGSADVDNAETQEGILGGTEDGDATQSTTVVFTGDIELSPYVQRNYDASGIDGVVAQKLREELTEADILEVNNEFAFSERGEPAPDKQYTFRVHPSYVSILTELGVDVAGLANNHVLDYGRDALTDTFATLSDAGIAYTGAGTDVADASKLVTVEANGKTFGFLAASRVIPVGSWNVENAQPGVFTCYDTTALESAIRDARNQVDYLFVCVHWGTEHTDVLTDYQRPNAHSYIDAGADAVIGAHPHVLQGIEYYNGKPIFYSLGNFIFNENISSTMAVEFTITPEDEVEIRLLPATASSATTSLATGDKAASIYDYLMSISEGVEIDENGKMTSQ